MGRTEHALDPHLMDCVADRIETETGLSFRAARRRDLREALDRMARSKDMSADELADWMLSGSWDKARSDLCALHLTIGETYFFREPRAFGLVSEVARKKLQGTATNRQLRIWSAGCCTGEEAYSIAMTLHSLLPEAARRRVSILATDINRRSLQAARAGLYRQWSFRKTEVAQQGQYFSAQGERRFRINDDIRAAVHFAELNLASAAYPSAATDTQAMDIIFCRNVLMYFSPEQVKKVIARFRECLVDDGWLVVSPSEASSEMFVGFTAHYFPDAIYFQKSAMAEEARTPRAPIAVNSAHFAPEGVPPAMPAALAPARPRARAPGGNPATGPGRRTKTAPRASVATATSAKYGKKPDTSDPATGRQQAAEGGKRTSEMYHADALMAIESGDQRVAVQNLRRVLYLQPDFILGHYLMGVLQSRLNRDEDAAKQFRATNELLAELEDDDIVPGSDGLHAAYLRESVRSYLKKER